MFHGKCKAVTFSYDDGVSQDVRLIALLDKYGLKATFNLNSGMFGACCNLTVKGETVTHNLLSAEEAKKLYVGHEVAVHTLTHPNLTTLPDQEVIRQVETDRENLSKLFWYEVYGMAYPCGGVNNDDRVAEVIRQHTSIKFARTITSSYSFDRQENLLRFNPTLSHMDERLFSLADAFLAASPDRDRIFYIWGHSYELDAADGWNMLEKFCALISGKDDVFYGTNSEVLLCGENEKN